MQGRDSLPALHFGIIMHGGARTRGERPYSIAALRNDADFILVTRYRSASRPVTN
jgi:hypothetical protein